jgi:hypothetical protein
VLRVAEDAIRGKPGAQPTADTGEDAGLTGNRYEDSIDASCLPSCG